MHRTTSKIAIALAASALMSGAAFAADNANANGSKANPVSSTAVTPSGAKHSPGTVGAMKHAEEGSFTAPKSVQKNVHLK